MSFIQIGNLIIINIIIWLIIGYFWSNWSFKLFKPYIWLDKLKSKSIHSQLRKAERHCKDKNRFYAHWMYMQQVDMQQVDGCIVFAGIEELQYANIASLVDGEREIFLIDTFETETIEVIKENCQGEISKQSITLKKPMRSDVDKMCAENKQITVVEGFIAEKIESIGKSIAFASIDSVRYEDVTIALKYIYKQLSVGGIIIVHDVNHDWDSVRQAVAEFEASIPEKFIGLPDMFGSAALVKNGK